jgi:hypothetical protein
MDWIYTTSFGNTVQSVGDWSICRYSPQKDCTAWVEPHPPRWRSSWSPIVAASTSRAVLEVMQIVVRDVSDCASQNRGIIRERLQYCAGLRVRFLNSAPLQWLTITHRKQLNQVAWSLCVLSTLTVRARCHCRAWVLLNSSWDNSFIADSAQNDL